jgi:hypothetical protein
VALALLAITLGVLGAAQALAYSRHARASRGSCRAANERHRHGSRRCSVHQARRHRHRASNHRLHATPRRFGVVGLRHGGGSTTPPSRLYWGATIGQQFTGTNAPWDWNAVTDFEKLDAAGKGMSVATSGAQFYSKQYCGGYCGFQTALFTSVRNHGAIPMISWQSTTDSAQSGFTDAEIAAGSQDPYITQWAQAAKAWGHPFFLRFDWEMNGNWLGWSPGVDGNTAASFVAMWQHIHTIFVSAGATNATWVWCPNVDPNNTWTSLQSVYPGDAYVDWTGLDGYNGDTPWTSFQSLYQSTYNTITRTLAPSKPMIIGEVGSTETGGSKAQWISNMLSELPTQFPKIHGVLWFDVSDPGPGGHTDWPLESSPTAETAFATGINNPAYVANNYTNLNTSPIPAPKRRKSSREPRNRALP